MQSRVQDFNGDNDDFQHEVECDMNGEEDYK